MRNAGWKPGRTATSANRSKSRNFTLLNKILSEYRVFLETVDRWFDRCVAIAGPAIKCRRACAACCRGLFEISLLDARLLQEGFSLLGKAQREKPLEQARKRTAQLQRQWPGFRHPFILNLLPHDEWLEMPEDDEHAEEGGAGARAMLDSGLFEEEPVTAIFAGHMNPELPVVETSY